MDGQILPSANEPGNIARIALEIVLLVISLIFHHTLPVELETSEKHGMRHGIMNHPHERNTLVFCIYQTVLTVTTSHRDIRRRILHYLAGSVLRSSEFGAQIHSLPFVSPAMPDNEPSECSESVRRADDDVGQPQRSDALEPESEQHLEQRRQDEDSSGQNDDDEKETILNLEKEEKRAKREFRIAVTFALIVVIAVITAVSIVAVESRRLSHSQEVTLQVVVMNDAQAELDLLLQTINANPVVSAALAADIPTSALALAGKFQDAAQPPQVRAASWVLQAGPIYNNNDNLIRRFALATIYYANGGTQWNNQTNWLTSSTQASHCDWYGVVCCSNSRMLGAPVCLGPNFSNKTDNVIELTLSMNNLNGTISPAVGLLLELVTIDFSFNSLTGSIPNEIIGSLPTLGILYLQHNQLTGSVAASLRNSGTLRKCDSNILMEKMILFSSRS